MVKKAIRRAGAGILAVGGLAVVVLLMAAGASSSTAQVAGEDAALRTAIEGSAGQWRSYPEGLPRIKAGSPGALAFPAGVSYAEALTAVFIAQMTGDLPAGAELVEPLPEGKVLLDDASGVTIDLRAPYGYDGASGMVHTALLQMAGSLSAEQVSGARESVSGPWPVGAALGVPVLPACQVITSREETGATCGPRDDTVIEDMGPPLP